MTDWNGFRGAAKRLDDVDLPRIGHRIGVGEDEIHAFMDVEAAGSGFDSRGRPKMLFEPHVFYRNLSGTKRTKAVNAGLAYSRWGQRPYPRDSYPRLEQAMQIDETAALKSASWGLGQVLGENYRIVGYNTPQAMVREFMEDEEAHLEAMIQFLIANHIDDDLRAHRWSTVARVYNGPGYAKHNYDGRMAIAFAKWQRIKDTPWVPGDEPPPDEPEGPVDRVSLTREGQSLLEVLGHDPGPVDGKDGPRTRAATLAYQKTKPELVNDGRLGPKTLTALRADVKRLESPDDPGDTTDPEEPDEDGWFIRWLNSKGGGQADGLR